MKKSRRTPAKVVTNLMFAGDIALLSEGIEQAQELLGSVKVEAEKVELHINAKKTEVMQYGYYQPVIIDKAQELLGSVKVEAEKIELHINAKKTEVMQYGYYQPVIIDTKSGKQIKVVDSGVVAGGQRGMPYQRGLLQK